MPIPIPIPMPMGPPTGAKFPHPPQMGHTNFHHHQQQQQQQSNEEGEPEVKKIYLLQPMPKVQPQPQLKGGGFMGPVQTHIHLPGSMHASSHKFRARQLAGSKSGGSGGGESGAGGDYGQLEAGEHTTKQTGKGVDVKILPIVMIPPVAPIPPVQVSTSTGGHYQQPRMTLTPQFNNYIVSSGERKRLSPHLLSGQRNRHNHHHQLDQSSFADYGGSTGGSMFRENYAARSRSLRGRNSHRQQVDGRARSRDYDYGDYSDYDSSAVGGGGGGGASSLRSLNSDYQYQAPMRMNSRRSYRSSSNQLARPHYQRSASQQDGYLPRVNSIRDIVEQHQAMGQFEDDQAPLSHQEALGELNDELIGARSRHQINLDLSYNEATPFESSRDSSKLNRLSSADASLLDEIDREIYSQLSQQQQQRQQNKQNQDNLNYLYYDREPSQQQTTIMDQRAPAGRLNPSSSSDSLSGRSRPRGASGASGTSGGARLAYPDERDLFDDDEWRFDSIKSVTHVAKNNDTMTKNNTSTLSNNITTIQLKRINSNNSSSSTS